MGQWLKIFLKYERNKYLKFIKLINFINKTDFKSTQRQLILYLLS